MSSASFHTLATVFLTACVILLVLGNYYGVVMTLDIKRRLPDSRWSWLDALLTPLSKHRKYFPESQTYKKYLICGIGMLVCGYLYFLCWTRSR
jgi:hypothetical protein